MFHYSIHCHSLIYHTCSIPSRNIFLQFVDSHFIKTFKTYLQFVIYNILQLFHRQKKSLNTQTYFTFYNKHKITKII